METTDMAKQLGVGPSLFLMSTKAYAWFFLFLTILNIPVMLFYVLGNDSTEIKIEGFTDIFALLSMGNIGQTGFACGGLDMTNAYQITSVTGGTL